MGIKRQTAKQKLAADVELVAFLIDVEADEMPDDMRASDLAHQTVDHPPGQLSLAVFLHSIASRLREFAEDIRTMRR